VQSVVQPVVSCKRRCFKDLLERLRSRSKRQPIDRIDEPSEWRDRYRMHTPGRLLIERHQPLSLPVIFSGGMESKLGRFEKGLSDGTTWRRQLQRRKSCNL